jgi:uncharacterized membrane protein
MQTIENNGQNHGSEAENSQPNQMQQNPASNTEAVQPIKKETDAPPSPSQPNLIDKTAEQAASVSKEAAQDAVAKGSEQLQQLGTQEVQELGNVVGKVMQPKMENQPPVNKDEKIYAAISYVPFVALVSIIIKPDSSFVRLHAKQGLLLAIIFFFIGIFAAIVSLFGIIGQLLAFVLGLVPLAALIIAVYSMYLSFMGYWWKIPVLGAVADVIPVEWMAKTSKENITGQAGMAKEDYDIRQDAMSKEKAEAQAPKAEIVQNATIPSNTESNVLPTQDQNALPQQPAQKVESEKKNDNDGGAKTDVNTIQGENK